MKVVLACIFICSSLSAITSHALVEARVSYGVASSSTSARDLCSTCISQNRLDKNLSGIGADGIVKLPISYLPAIGIRYESLGSNAQSDLLDLNLSYNRTAVLVQWRPLDSTFYFGPTFTYGLSHSLNSKAREQETEKANVNAKSAESYSAGFEAGFKVIDFLIGAEIGYNELQWKNAKDASGNLQDIDLSGAYGKLILGFSI